MPIWLEAHNGPNDGLRRPWPEEQTELRLSSDQEENMVDLVTFGPGTPAFDVLVRRIEDGVEVRVGNAVERRTYGDLFEVASVWLSVGCSEGRDPCAGANP